MQVGGEEGGFVCSFHCLDTGKGVTLGKLPSAQAGGHSAAVRQLCGSTSQPATQRHPTHTSVPHNPPLSGALCCGAPAGQAPACT